MIAKAAPIAATGRPLSLERRRDIQAESLIVRGQRWWRLKDPLRLQFWQFGDEEHFLWKQLEGDVSLRDLQFRFGCEFAPRRIELSHLHQFLGSLHREGLVYSTAAGQGEILLERRQQRELRNRWQTLTNVLAIRFRGIDPTGLLDWLYPRTAWLFSSTALTAFGLLILSALLLAAISANEILARLPRAGEFLTPGNLLWLGATLGIVKVLHELGHALVCRHYGGRCHELGFMLLLFTPCLYCNVSDAWLLPSRWRRMAISAAGMFVELVLAAAATWLWWFSEPGLFSTLCLNVMVICSINTLLFNGNPLLRFDGYFLLSDFLDMPNLRQASDEWLRNGIARVLFGIPFPAETPLVQRAPVLIAYACASVTYRLCLTMIVWWFIYHWLAHLNLAIIGAAIVGLSATSMLSQSACDAWRTYSTAKRDGRLRRGRAVLSLLVTSAVVILVGLIPWPRSVVAPAVLRPASAETVYVTISGMLRESVAVGDLVQKGDVVAQLWNPELEQELVKLSSERDVQRQQVESLKRQQVQNSRPGTTSASGSLQASGQLQIVEQHLADIEARLEQKRADLNQLTIRAPTNGTVLSAREMRRKDQSNELDRWQGTPLDPENAGCYLEPGDAVCHIGGPARKEAFLVVEQSDIDFLREGQLVTLQLEELPGQNLRGSVHRIAELSAEAIPPEFAARQTLPFTGDSTRQLAGTHYQVLAELQSGPPIPFGAAGFAKVEVQPQSFAARAYHWLRRTFRW